jgi:hypothetical protein
MRDEIVAYVGTLIGATAKKTHRAAHRDPEPAGRDVAALSQALVGAAESLADWANETPGTGPREAAATLMNFCWAGLGNLMNNERWSPR